MNAAAKHLLSEALQLSEEEREELGWALLDTVLDAEAPQTVDDAWRTEARARLIALREGRANGSPWRETEARLRAQFRRP